MAMEAISMSKKTLVSVGTQIDYINAEQITPDFIEQARREMRIALAKRHDYCKKHDDRRNRKVMRNLKENGHA
jgi:hypothetical protein